MTMRRGFTLIELMVAMAIVTFGLLVIMGLFAATVLLAQRTEIDLVTDVAYSNAVRAIEYPGAYPGEGFSAKLLGNISNAPPIGPGEEFSYADETNGVILGVSTDYAVAVNFGPTTITHWFSVRPVFDGAAPPPPTALPGEVGLRYVTVHTGHIERIGDYTGSPHEGETLNDFVLIGVAPDEMDN